MNPGRSERVRPLTRAGWFVLLLVGGIVAGGLLPAEASYDTTVVVVETDTGLVRGRVRVAVAQTPRQHYAGLSHVQRLDTGTGMLFVYDREDTRSFYMRSMDFPLDILFVGGDGRVRRIVTAPRPDPGTPLEDLVRYRGRARWVLEVNAGWSHERGVQVGDRLRIESRSRGNR